MKRARMIMRKPVQVALAVLLVAIAGLVAWEMLRQREPVYLGKPLSFWLRGFELDDQPGKPGFNEAVGAVRDAGTNAFPILLHMLRIRDSDLKHRLTRFAQKQRLISVHYLPADRQNWVARQGFVALGKETTYAVPSLVEIYDEGISRGDTNSLTLGYITEILELLKDTDTNGTAAQALRKIALEAAQKAGRK